MFPTYYRLKEGDTERYWNIEEGRFDPGVERSEDSPGVVDVESLDILRTNLKFYGKSLGELASPADRIEALIEDNKEYLLKVLLLYSMDMEVPQEALQKFATLKKEILSLADTQAVTAFLSGEKE